MTSRKDRAIVVSALKHAAPYIRLFKGKVFVLKAGGEIFADPAQTKALMEQVGILYQVGIRVVLVHGGGQQSTELAAALGMDTTFVDGRRVTDDASLDVATMVLNGQINTRVLAACRDLQIPAVGISGVDAGLIRAHRRPPVQRDGEDPVEWTTGSSAISTPSTPMFCASNSITASCPSSARYPATSRARF